jgi:hypothetical protein
MSWTEIQNNSATSAAGTGTLSCAFTSNVTAGNYLFAASSNYSAFLSTGITDSQGNTWNQIIEYSGGSGAHIELWKAVAGSSAVNTVNAVGQNFSVLGIIEFNPGGGIVTADGSAVMNLNAGSTSMSTGNITLANPTLDLVLAAFAPFGTGYTYTPGSGYTAAVNVGYAAGHTGLLLEYALGVASSPANPSGTVSTSTYWAGVGAAFTSTGSAATYGGACLLAAV